MAPVQEPLALTFVSVDVPTGPHHLGTVTSTETLPAADLPRILGTETSALAETLIPVEPAQRIGRMDPTCVDPLLSCRADMRCEVIRCAEFVSRQFGRRQGGQIFLEITTIEDANLKHVFDRKVGTEVRIVCETWRSHCFVVEHLVAFLCVTCKTIIAQQAGRDHFNLSPVPMSRSSTSPRRNSRGSGSSPEYSISRGQDGTGHRL